MEQRHRKRVKMREMGKRGGFESRKDCVTQLLGRSAEDSYDVRACLEWRLFGKPESRIEQAIVDAWVGGSFLPSLYLKDFRFFRIYFLERDLVSV